MLTALSRVIENWEERNEGGDFEQKVSYYTSPLMNLQCLSSTFLLHYTTTTHNIIINGGLAIDLVFNESGEAKEYD